LYGIKQKEILVPSDTEALCTFDVGSFPYTIPSTFFGLTNDGYEGAGGNPDNCVRGESVFDEDIVMVQLDLGEDKSVNEITLDLYVSNLSEASAFIWIDTTTFDSIVFDSGMSAGSWYTHVSSEAESSPPSYPIVGRYVQVFLQANSGKTLANLRIDNIKVEYD